MTTGSSIHIGCAGWTIPAATKIEFGDGSSHLARYAARLPAVEINSSFYRPHRPATYARWAESTPPDFRFAVKVPRRITHELRLREADDELRSFLAGPHALGPKLAVLLVQLPPSLQLERESADHFFTMLRNLTTTRIACEPRHRSWFEPQADEILRGNRIARVAADPALVPAAGMPGGDDSFVYFRLHGSPTMYCSEYSESYLENLSAALRFHAVVGRTCWCIFDNTAAGAAATNALRLSELTAVR
jgi:uncharacterized protein YecE (DUF72 family)